MRLPPAEFEPDDAAVLESLISLLRYAAGQLELLFRDVRRVDYVAIAAAARTALGDEEAGSELTIHQGEQLRHLLVDEFQDTSLDQFELLEALTRDWAPGDGRSLFLVGDPMQSIYQFREAEVGLFLRARDSGIGRIALEPLALTRNFRSDATIVDFVNRTFSRDLPGAGRSARGGGALPRLRGGYGARSRRWRRACGCGTWRRYDEQGEAEAVLQIVRGLRAEAPQASIAVLVSARSHAAPIARALRAGGVAVQGVDLIPLAEVPAVQDLMSLTRAVLDPVDRAAWIGVLRAPWCGLSLGELALLFEGAPQATLGELLDDELRRHRLDADCLARLLTGRRGAGQRRACSSGARRSPRWSRRPGWSSAAPWPMPSPARRSMRGASSMRSPSASSPANGRASATSARWWRGCSPPATPAPRTRCR